MKGIFNEFFNLLFPPENLEDDTETPGYEKVIAVVAVVLLVVLLFWLG